MYQDREELLLADAAKLQLEIVSKDAELDALVAKTGATLAPQLREILQWTADRTAAPTQLSKVHKLLASVDSLLASAQKQRALGADDAQEAKRQLQQKIRQSVGVRNEDVALQSYAQQHGCDVRLTNDHWYFLKFPPLPPAAHSSPDVFAALNAQAQRLAVPKDTHASTSDDATDAPPAYFSICGMVDGVADVLTISSDDDWTLMPVVVEVKNRMRAFRDPPPLHDHIQMAVYMKMLALTQGDLVQCLHTDGRAHIHVSRVALSTAPLCGVGTGGDVWTHVVLPRLYEYASALERVRANELLRLAFLNGSQTERLAILRRECAFL